ERPPGDPAHAKDQGGGHEGHLGRDAETQVVLRQVAARAELTGEKAGGAEHPGCSTAPAYSSTGPPARPGCSSPGHPTTPVDFPKNGLYTRIILYSVQGARGGKQVECRPPARFPIHSPGNRFHRSALHLIEGLISLAFLPSRAIRSKATRCLCMG